ncbi:MAG TPA: Ig-like domain-containing protein [Myxococcaceae bacterium]|nr:Ig-like domain-containing protein [Myxococcaceae bacterium]
MSLLASLSLLSATGCQTSVEPEVKEAARVVERLRSHRLEVKEEGTKQPRSVLPPAGGVRVERAEGGLTVKPEKATRGDSRRPARVVLPEVAQQPFQVKDLHSGMMLEVALEGARAAKAEVVDGYVVYPDAHAEGADVVHRFTPEGTEDYLSFERAPSVPEVRYGLKLGAGAAGLRLVDDTLEVLDGSGAPRLRMAPPYLVGADGRVTQAHVSVEGCAVDTRTSAPWERPLTAPGSRQCRVRVGWDAGAVKYPAVLDPVWGTTGSLAEARRGFTTTVLPDGRVLAAGGDSPMVGTLSSAELYDPATGTWAATGSLPMAQVGHSAHLLGSGQVLMVGGELTGTVELYDPATGTWSSRASMGTARRGHRTVLLNDGRVLAIGGADASYSGLTSVELYDPATNTWAPTGSLSVPRDGHGSVLLADGKVLVFGGIGMAEATSELYDPTTGTWSPGGALFYGRVRPLAERLADGRVLMFGGWRQEVEVYDPATNTWSFTSPTLQRRQHATSTLLPDGRVLAVGGMSGTSGSEDSATTELYDPTTGTWSLGPSMGSWRGLHSASVLQDGRVLIAGGMGSAAYVTLATAELLLLDVDDVTAPVATVTSPTEGASVEGEVLLTADASDDYSLRRVEFFAGGTLIGTDTSAPFSVSWYTPWNVPNGSYVLTVRAYDASGNVGTSAPVSVLVNNDVTPPTVALTSPAANSAFQGQGLVTLSADASDERGVVERVEFWDGRRQLGVDTEPPYSMSWDLGSVPGGPHTLIAKAYDVAGNVGTSASVPVSVSQAGTAAYDSTMQVLRCATVGTVCDSGSYLDGRGTLEPELNQPNTLQGSCADGTAGEHYGPSLDRIRISSVNGSPLGMGGNARIEVSVFATTSYHTEALDLYSTADATNPVWTYLTTLYPGGSNARTLAISFTLPVGTVQALRGRYRSGGFSAPCGSGAYDDHDDLVFAVGPDVTAPLVSFSSPAAGAMVKGTTSLYVGANDGVGVTRVEFYDGATLLGTDTTSPYSYAWNTTGVANGTHTLTARAYDAAGNMNSATLSVTVNNSVADTTAPTVSLTAPAAGALLTRGVTYTLTASASDNVGVARVEFFLDGALLGSDTTAPYSLSWYNNTTVGSHSLLARAYDAAGNVASSTAVTVSVQNPPPPSGNTLTYSASNTSSASVNTVNQTIFLMPGQVLTLGTCGVTGASFSGDTYLRLYNPSSTQVVSSDDACGGMGSSFTYTVPAGAGGNYQLRAGCYSSGSCSGTVAWTIR